MLAFHEPAVDRPVTIPDAAAAASESHDRDLALIFHYGQNDFQPVAGVCSVSVGDVIDYYGTPFVVMPFGFAEWSRDRVAEYERTPRADRWQFIYGDKAVSGAV
jgi:hypothetical protein